MHFWYISPSVLTMLLRGGKGKGGKQELFWEDMEKAEFIVCNTTAAGTEMMPLEAYLVSRLPFHRTPLHYCMYRYPFYATGNH